MLAFVRGENFLEERLKIGVWWRLGDSNSCFNVANVVFYQLN